MEELPSIKIEEETFNKLNLILIPIELNKNKYHLKINCEDDIITFELVDIEKIPCVNYIRTMNFEEIKELNQLFKLLKTYNDFYDYINFLSKNKKINIKKDKDKISIILLVDVLSKQQEIQIDLLPEKKDFELRMNKKIKEMNDLKSKFDLKLKEIEDLKKQINECSKENEDLKKQNIKLITKIDSEKNHLSITFILDSLIYTIGIMIFLLIILIGILSVLKTDNNELFKKLYKIIFDNEISKINDFNQSIIMKRDENNMIFSEIQNKMNKPIKEIKKLYQATIDGGEPENFHKKCDNISNTLVLIKSEGNRRFGGFTPIPWKSYYSKDEDIENKTFIFSLDNKKIYYLKSTFLIAAYQDKGYGPCFGYLDDIVIKGNPIKE